MTTTPRYPSRPNCEAPGCDRAKPKSGGRLCVMHAKRIRRYGTYDLPPDRHARIPHERVLAPLHPAERPGAPEPACRGYDTDLWFPEQGDHAQKAKRARAICRRCPLLNPCREWAIPQPRLVGIWGNTNTPQRERERARMHQPNSQP